MSGPGFTVEDDAAIGCCVRAFGALEHLLGGLLIDLRVMADPNGYGPESTASRKLVADLKASLAGRAKLVADELEALYQEEPEKWAPLAACLGLIGEIADARNMMLHGVWSKPAEGVLLAQLWSRETLPDLRRFPAVDARPDSREWSREDMVEIGRSSARLCKYIHEIRSDIASCWPY